MTGSDVQTRAAAARTYLEVAELVASEDDAPRYRQVAVALAVLSGIAAGDAMCGHVLGERSRAQDHGQAADLLRLVKEAGPAVGALVKLLDMKDSAHYGTAAISAERSQGAVRSARAMVDRMDVLLRS